MQVFKINIDNGRVLYCGDSKYAKKVSYTSINNEGRLDKELCLEMDDCFRLSAYQHGTNFIDLRKTKNLSFLIDENNPMYEGFKSYLGDEREAVIQDDNYDTNKKSIQIIDGDGKINIIYKCDKEVKENIQDKFVITIRRMANNGRRYEVTGNEFLLSDERIVRLNKLFEEFARIITADRYRNTKAKDEEEVER